MSTRAIELAERKARLQARIAAQREGLAVRLAPVGRLCQLADKGVEGVRWLQRHPLAVAGGVAAAVALRPRGAWTWMKRGWAAWRLIRKVRARFAKG